MKNDIFPFGRINKQKIYKDTKVLKKALKNVLYKLKNLKPHGIPEYI